MNVNRRFVIEQLIRKKNAKTYLEIGVFKGMNFFPIRASRKIAVDPYFKLKWYKRLWMHLKMPANIWESRFFEKESDRFFSENADKVFDQNALQVSLVDGMHEYGYALRDVENCLQYLEDGGVIVMHDCNPITREHAGTFEEWKAAKFIGKWNGDVWKSIVHLRSTRDDINVFVLDCDEGLGIVTKGKPEKQLSFTPEQISNMGYDDLERDRAALLNLKPADYFFDYFNIRS
jgi:hypothetical protein